MPLRQSIFAAMLCLLALTLAGCATMSEDECRTVDWRTIGYEDGSAGYPGDRIAQHRKACAEYGVSPDLSAYQSGRQDGLREYCQPANAYRIGVRGGSYGGICPADMDAAFNDAYQAGRQLYTLASRVSNAAEQLDSKRRELNRVEDQIVRSSAAVLSGGASDADRAQAVVDTKQLAERAGRLKAEIEQLERDKGYYERELEAYRASTPEIG